MNQDKHLPYPIDAHRLGCIPVIDFIHHLHLQEVIPRPQGSQLGNASLFGLAAYLVRVRPFETA
ncbi:hypothetical protein ES703_111598 [subsurface metagenome]